MTMLPVTVRPVRLSVTSTLVVAVSRRRGARLRARSEMSLAMSERSSWKRFGLEASSKSVPTFAPRGDEREFILLGANLRLHGPMSSRLNIWSSFLDGLVTRRDRERRPPLDHHSPAIDHHGAGDGAGQPAVGHLHLDGAGVRATRQDRLQGSLRFRARPASNPTSEEVPSKAGNVGQWRSELTSAFGA